MQAVGIYIIAISLYYTVAKGTISEGGEENVHGHKLTAQTYSASVGVKPKVVIWEASEVCYYYML